jgi:hypothetical protein
MLRRPSAYRLFISNRLEATTTLLLKIPTKGAPMAGSGNTRHREVGAMTADAALVLHLKVVGPVGWLA